MKKKKTIKDIFKAFIHARFWKTSPGIFVLTIVTIPTGIFVISCAMNIVSQLVGYCTGILPVDLSQNQGEARDFFRYGEAVVGVVAALLVVHQLSDETKAERSETLMQQSDFIKQFNLSFISESPLTKVERVLEKNYTERNKDFSIEAPGTRKRQEYINYLAYLESLATVIQNGAMEIKNIDSLMSYRFFIAANNPELQKKELLPFSIHYRGIFRLYEDWVIFRYDEFNSLAAAALKACKNAISISNKPKYRENRDLFDHDLFNKVKDALMNNDYSQLAERIKDAIPGAEKSSELRNWFEANFGNNKENKKCEIGEKDRKKLEEAVTTLETLALHMSVDEKGTLNGCLGIPLFSRENCLYREETASVYIATIGKPSRLPEILRAFFPEDGKKQLSDPDTSPQKEPERIVHAEKEAT